MTTGKAKVIGSFEPLEGDDLTRANELKMRGGRHSIEEAILRLQAETGKYFALNEAVYAGAIKSYAPGDDKDPIVCEPHQRDLREEIYWDDVIKWIAIEFPRFKYPVTSTPTAPETPEQRRARWLLWHSEVPVKRGALQRVYEREKLLNPSADRSFIGKEINKAKKEKTEGKSVSPMYRQLVQYEKRTD